MSETKNDYKDDIEQCLEVLKAGGIILYPTDTIWGLGCDATNAEAVEKIIQIKERPLNKSFVVLVTSEKEVMQHVASPDPALFVYLAELDQPTTVIYDNALGLSDNVLAQNGSVAIRICKDEFCRHLIKRFKKPIVSTSANISGEPSPKIFIEIDSLIKERVDYVVNYRQDDNAAASASSIIQWNNGKLKKIR